MTSKTVAALALAAAVCLTPCAAQAHHGHQHPAKVKKVKKTKASKKAAAVICFAVQPLARHAPGAPMPGRLRKNIGLSGRA